MVIRESKASRRSGSTLWWFAVGAVAGLAVCTLRSRRPGKRSGEGTPLSRGLDRLEQAWDDTIEGVTAIRDRWIPAPEADVAALTALARSVAGSDHIVVEPLAPGVVEVVGTLPDDESARRVLDALADGAGVGTVLSRIWTGTGEEAHPEPPAGTTDDVRTSRPARGG